MSTQRQSPMEKFFNHPHHALFITIGIFVAAGVLMTNSSLTSARTLLARGNGEQEEDRSGSSRDSDDVEEDREAEFSATPKPSETPQPNATPEIEDEDEPEDEDEREEEIEIEREDENEEEFEEELPDQTERLRLRTEDGRQRIDVTSGDVRVRLEERDGEVRLKAESEGREFELEADGIEAVRQRLLQTGLLLTASEGGRLRIERRGLPVRTTLPVSVDLSTNRLFVMTSAGEKAVAVLPDRAAMAVFNAGLSEVEPDEFSALNPANEMELTQTENGELTYEAITLDERRLLGLMPVRIRTRVHVSAEDGQVVSAEGISLLDQFLSFFSR